VQGCYIHDCDVVGIEFNSTANYNAAVNNRVEDCDSSAISMSQAEYCLIQGNSIVDCGALVPGNIYVYQADYNRIIANKIEDTRGASGFTGITLYGAMSKTAQKNEIIGNTIKGCLYGVELIVYFYAPYDNIIIGNLIYDCYYQGISSSGARTLIEGNTIDGADDSGMILYGSQHTVIGNNILNSGKNGIQLQGAYQIIMGNMIDTCQWDGIRGENVIYSTITGNRIEDCSKAAHNLFSGIYLFGTYAGAHKMNNIYDNYITIPTSGNRKMYSIREYGSYVDYNMIRGNRCKDAITGEINVVGVNSEAFDNTILGT
jgi:parallel beta-helix repeat protein